MINKLLYIGLIIAGFVLVSCEKDKIGSTATEALAGEWTVTVNTIDANGNQVLGEDPFGLGHIMLATYNTVANVPTEMWIDDNGQFWTFKSIVTTDINSLTFSATNAANVVEENGTLTITNGKILPGMATTPSGMPADSIVFDINFSPDTNPAENGFDRYRVSGHRYTGFVADE